MTTAADREIGQGTGNPFPGLRPFEPEEADLFFGRDDDIDELLVRLQRGRFLAVLGSSGCGKSSLINAGLVASIRRGFLAIAGTTWRIARMRPGDRPLGHLAQALGAPDVLGDSDEPPGEAAYAIEAVLRRGPGGFAAAVTEAHLQGGPRLLVIVDQFEELFRFIERSGRPGARDEAQAFVKLLLEAASQRSHPIYVVVAMRSDYLGACTVFRGLSEAINDGLYLVPQLTREQFREVIVQPVADAGGRIAPGLVNRLLNDLGDDPDQLPVLQHALMRMWDCTVRGRSQGEADSITLDVDAYERVGRLERCLANHVEEVFAELDPHAQALAAIMFRRLTDVVEGHKVRRHATVQEIADVAEETTADVKSLVEVFRAQGRSFLVLPDGPVLEDRSLLDISHESLIRKWSRLDRWVQVEVDAADAWEQLARAAQDHAVKKSSLLSGRSLKRMRIWVERERPNAHWAARYGGDFQQAMAFLRASVRRARIWRWVLYPTMGLGVLLALGLPALGGAWLTITRTDWGLRWSLQWEGGQLATTPGISADALTAWALSDVRWERFPAAATTLRTIRNLAAQGQAVDLTVSVLLASSQPEAARILAVEASEPERRSTLLARVALASTPYESNAIEAARAARQAADNIRDPLARVQTLIDVVPALVRAGEVGAATATIEESRTRLEGMPESERRANTTARVAESLARSGLVAQAQAFAGLIQDPRRRAATLVSVAEAVALGVDEAGSPLSARPIALRAVEVVRTVPSVADRSLLLIDAAKVLALAGQYAEASQSARDAVAAARGATPGPGQAQLFALLAKRLADGGRAAEALEVAAMIGHKEMSGAFRPSRALGPWTDQDAALGEVGVTLARAGRRSDAIEAVRRMTKSTQPMALAAVAVELARAGFAEEAREVVSRIPSNDRQNILREVAYANALTARAGATDQDLAVLEAGKSELVAPLLVRAGRLQNVEAHLNRISDPGARIQAAVECAREAVARNEGSAAVRWITDVLPLLDRFDDLRRRDQLRRVAVLGLAAAVAAGADAGTTLRTAENAAHTIETPDEREVALRVIAAARARQGNLRAAKEGIRFTDVSRQLTAQACVLVAWRAHQTGEVGAVGRQPWMVDACGRLE